MSKVSDPLFICVQSLWSFIPMCPKSLILYSCVQSLWSSIPICPKSLILYSYMSKVSDPLFLCVQSLWFSISAAWVSVPTVNYNPHLHILLHQSESLTHVQFTGIMRHGFSWHVAVKLFRADVEGICIQVLYESYRTTLKPVHNRWVSITSYN